MKLSEIAIKRPVFATVMSLAIMSGPVMFILFAATVVISNRYPMTAEKHRRLMAEIHARRAGEEIVLAASE